MRDREKGVGAIGGKRQAKVATTRKRKETAKPIVKIPINCHIFIWSLIHQCARLNLSTAPP